MTWPAVWLLYLCVLACTVGCTATPKTTSLPVHEPRVYCLNEQLRPIEPFIAASYPTRSVVMACWAFRNDQWWVFPDGATPVTPDSFVKQWQGILGPTVVFKFYPYKSRTSKMPNQNPVLPTQWESE
jgi:hypothetical protein